MFIKYLQFVFHTNNINFFIDNSIPDEFLCPISREVMTDPVVASGNII